MAQALIQFTQGGNVGNPGQSVLGFVRGVAVTMTDAAGSGAISWSWQIISWPSPLSAPVTVTSPTAQITTTSAPTTDGVYVVRLIRVDSSGTTADVRFFGVSDEDGLILPSPGQSANLHNIGPTPTLAIAAGWAGRADATTNDQLDAYLRFVKTRVGRYVGQVQRINFTSSSPSTVTYTDNTDKPFRILNLTGTGAYTEELSTAGVTAGKAVRYLVSVAAGSGGFALHNGVSGSTLLSFSAPTSGTNTYAVLAVFDGTNWLVAHNIAQNFSPNQYVKTDGSGVFVSSPTININDLTVGSQARGDISFFDGTRWTRLPAGTAGRVLQTNGAGADPSWATLSAINGASVPAAGALTTGHVLQVSGSSALSYGYVADANVAAGAAIAGSKVTPNFGSQDISTSGAITATKVVVTTSGPSLTTGTGVPASTSEPAGSLYLRQDGSDASTGLYTRQAGVWYPLGGGAPSGGAGGDLSGSYPNPTVVKINGATVSAAGSLTTGHVLQVSGASATSYGYVADANVAAAAAIAGTKVTPNFGSQNISTTGNLLVTTATVSQILFGSGCTPQWHTVQQINLSSGNHTLSSSEYACPVIEFIGATGADRDAVFPLVNANAGSTNGSVWFVRNATTGGNQVLIKGPTGTSVAVPFGASGIVYTDGTNFYALSASGSGGGASGTASGDLSGSYPNPVVAQLSGVGGIVKAIAPFLAIDGTITTAYTFTPDVSTSTSGAGFKYVFQGQHGQNSVSGTGGGVQIVGGNSTNSAAFAGALEVLLGNNTADTTKGGYVRIVQHSGVSGTLQAWIDGSAASIAGVLDTGLHLATGKKVYFGTSGISPVTITGPNISSGTGNPIANEPTGSVWLKSDATSTTDVLWVRQSSTWASLGAPSGSAGGDLSGTYPNPTVAKINGATVPASGSLTTSHVLKVSGAAALTYGFILNANVDPAAAIAGTKISPDFGSQLVQTTGNIQATKVVIGSSGPTITKGTGVPATTEPNGSIFLQTDGTDGATSVYSRQGGAWYVVGSGAGGPPTGPAGGDLSGTFPNPTVAKINGTSVGAAPGTGAVLVATSTTSSSWTTIVNANVNSAAAIAGTKISPDFGSQTVVATKYTVGSSGPTITKGTGVPVSSSEPIGSLFLRTDGATGADALYSYQASAWVAVGTGGGATPTGPAGGDLSGSYPNPTVAKLNGITAPASTPSVGQFIKASSTSALTYAALLAADIPAATTGSQGAITLASDLRGTASAPLVAGLTGTGGIIAAHSNALSWDSTLTPSITQVTPSSDLTTHDFSITTQAPFASASTFKSPGNLILAVPSPVGGGSAGKISFQISGSEQGFWASGALVLASATKLTLLGSSGPTITSAVGAPSGSAPDGSVYLASGASSASSALYVRAGGAWTALAAGGSSSASSVGYTDTNTPTFGQTNVQTVLDAIKALMAPGGVRLSSSTYIGVYGVSGAQSSSSSTFVGVGMIRFNPNHYSPAIDGGATKKVKFKAYLEGTSGLTAHVQLYDLTAGSVVASTDLSTASVTSVLLTSVDIAGSLASAEHDYEVQIRLAGSPSSGDRVTCKMAQLEVTYT